MKSSGFVLMAALIFLQMLSLLGLLGLMMARLQLKSTYHRWTNVHHQRLSIKILDQIQDQVEESLSHCGVAVMPSETLAAMKKHWWMQQGCSGEKEGVSYYYVIESLGEDPCSVLLDKNRHAPVPVIFYRLSLFVNFTKERDAKIILQSTIARPAVSSSSCDEVAHTVKQGLQMRRQLVVKGRQHE